MLFTLSRCGVGDLAVALKLGLDRAQQGFLIACSFGEDCVHNPQQRVDPLGEAPVKNACVVCRATPSEKAAPTAWIKMPSSSRVLTSSYCYAAACG